MTILTVGVGQEYSTIAAAVSASNSGDTINVQAGTYTNDFLTITHDVTLNAVDGTVTMVATEQPPNGKAMIDEGGSGISVNITGFDISGVTVPDGNGAAIRYEGGSLTLNDVDIHDNQEGLLSAADPTGTITIDNSTFANNGSGTGYTHNIYVGAIASLTVANSTITEAVGGHDIKSRAASTTIVNNTITDGSSGTGSYEIDLPNGGNATITGNVIEKGANATNPIAISFGEEGSVYASSSLTVSGNTILNDDTSAKTIAVVNATTVTASITDNTLYGWTSVSSGPAAVSGTTILTAEPALSSLIPASTASTSTDTTSTDTTTSSSTDTSSSVGSTTATDVTSDSSATASLTDVTLSWSGHGSSPTPLSWNESSGGVSTDTTVSVGSAAMLIDQSGHNSSHPLLHPHA